MKKIVVVGSGFGGLSIASKLKAKKFDVTLIEKHKDLGGRARTFVHNGFKYDAGPTVITAPYLIEELFEIFNKNPDDYINITPLKYGIDSYLKMALSLITQGMKIQWKIKLDQLVQMIVMVIKN